jgi:hypothetical protein
MRQILLFVECMVCKKRMYPGRDVAEHFEIHPTHDTFRNHVCDIPECQDCAHWDKIAHCRLNKCNGEPIPAFKTTIACESFKKHPTMETAWSPILIIGPNTAEEPFKI